MVLSYTVSEIRTPFFFGTLALYVPFGISRFDHEETGVMGLFCSEDPVIVA